MNDPFDLGRLVAAQDPVFSTVVAELTAGTKRTHWMWFVFPQIAGLGTSPTAQRYALGSLAEAQAFLAHPTLGPRLEHCTALANAIPDRSLGAIFGSPDDMKFCSSMTLFAKAATAPDLFETALRRFCGGEPDRATLALLKGG